MSALDEVFKLAAGSLGRTVSDAKDFAKALRASYPTKQAAVSRLGDYIDYLRFMKTANASMITTIGDQLYDLSKLDSLDALARGNGSDAVGRLGRVGQAQETASTAKFVVGDKSWHYAQLVTPRGKQTFSRLKPPGATDDAATDGLMDTTTWEDIAAGISKGDLKMVEVSKNDNFRKGLRESTPPPGGYTWGQLQDITKTSFQKIGVSMKENPRAWIFGGVAVSGGIYGAVVGARHQKWLCYNRYESAISNIRLDNGVVYIRPEKMVDCKGPGNFNLSLVVHSNNACLKGKYDFQVVSHSSSQPEFAISQDDLEECTFTACKKCNLSSPSVIDLEGARVEIDAGPMTQIFKIGDLDPSKILPLGGGGGSKGDPDRVVPSWVWISVAIVCVLISAVVVWVLIRRRK